VPYLRPWQGCALRPDQVTGISGLLDCTLREGSYKTAFSVHDCGQIARRLAGSGVRFFEVGVERGGDSRAPHASHEYIHAAAEAAPAVAPGIFVMAATASFGAIERAVCAGAKFVRIGADATSPESAFSLLAKIKKLDVTVALNAMKSHVVAEERLIATAVDFSAAGADVFYIVDSAGCMMPQAVRNLTQKLGESGVTVGFHGHDNLTLAVANSLAALAGGAVVVDGTLRGVGRSAGNAQIEVLAAAAQKLGLLPGVDFDQLAAAAEELIAGRLPADRGVSRHDLLLGATGCHSGWSELAGEVADRTGVPLSALLAALGQSPDAEPPLAMAEAAAAALMNGQDRTQAPSPAAVRTRRGVDVLPPRASRWCASPPPPAR
jgi:4-hydroxy 2-oxovalerate aldolase